MSTPNNVYLLMHASGLSFKIGIAVTTHKRATMLPDDIDMSRSLEASVTTGNAKSVEKILHYLCRDLSKTTERIEHGAVGDGYTEWFDVAAFDQARSFIDNHTQMLGLEPLRPVRVPGKDETRRVNSRLTTSSKETRAAKAEAERAIDMRRTAIAERQNLAVLRNLGDLIDSLRITGALLGLHLEEAPVLFESATLYLQAPSPIFLVEEFARPTERFLLSGVGGGGGQLFSGLSAADDLGVACLDVSWELLRERASDERPIPFGRDARALLSSLVPAPRTHAAAVVAKAHATMKRARNQFWMDFHRDFDNFHAN